MVFRAGLRDPCRETFGKRKNTRAAGIVFLHFPKVEKHPKCMDHAILLGKRFGIPILFLYNCSETMTF
jgi:hypothetical protein